LSTSTTIDQGQSGRPAGERGGGGGKKGALSSSDDVLLLLART